MKKGRISRLGTGGILLTSMLSLAVPLSAYAQTYYIEDGNITVTALNDGTQTVSQSGSDVTQTSETIITRNDTSQSSSNSVIIQSESGAVARVTIDDLSISAGPHVLTQGDGDVVIELNGTNILAGAGAHAALQKENSGNLTIKDASGTPGSLTATGGADAAGIGGGLGADGSNITISGGTVTATGGLNGAGIGGGSGADGSNITISGGTVTATGGDNAAGIGGSSGGNGINILISGGTVNAIAGNDANGIGRGQAGQGVDSIRITGGVVTTTGGLHAIGGNGSVEISGGMIISPISGTDITITGGRVIAVGEPGCPGIIFDQSTGDTLFISESAEVSVAGGAAGTDVNSIPFEAGPAMGLPVSRQNNHLFAPGIYYSPDTAGLYTTGYVKIYNPGTTADSIRNNPEANLVETIFGTVPAPVVINSSDIYISDNPDDSDTSDPEGYALFIKMVNALIERHLKQLNDYNAAGQYDKAGALKQKGIVIDAGVWISLTKENYVLIKKATDMGVPVTVNFAYKGANYSTTIPAYTKIIPVSLCNEEGYCGFLNLIKHYGGIVRK